MRDGILRRFVREKEAYLLAVIVVLVAVLSATTENFLSWRNLFDLLGSYAFFGVLAAGLLVVLISGGIDISFTATASVAQYVMASWLIAHDGSWPLSGWVAWNWAFAFGIAGGVGILLGLVNAVLIHYLRVSSIIITIATLNGFFGLLIFITRGEYLYNLPDWFSQGVSFWSFADAEGNRFDITLQIATLIAVFAATYLLLSRTAIGRQIYALGGNPEAARRLGFNILGLRLFVYGYMGLLAGVASIIQAQLAQSVAPTVLVGKELDVMAACVLGGASLAGGAGSVLGTILGLALLAIMQNGLILLGVSSYWSQVFVGLLILASVTVTAYSARRKARRTAR